MVSAGTGVQRLLVSMASHLYLWRDAAQLRPLAAAARVRDGTAGVEGAAPWRIERARHFAHDHHALVAQSRIGMRHRGQQQLRVGVSRPLGDLLGGAELDNAAEVHDGDPVAHVADQMEVMRDEQVGEAEAFLQLEQQVHDLGLDGDVERAHGLVEHHELRLDGERARNADALALTARELVGIAVEEGRTEADRAQKLDDTGAAGIAPLLPASRLEGAGQNFLRGQ